MSMCRIALSRIITSELYWEHLFDKRIYYLPTFRASGQSNRLWIFLRGMRAGYRKFNVDKLST